MKKIFITITIVFAVTFLNAQTAADLFSVNTVKVSWLGIDFSHTKLIGTFDQVQGAMMQSPSEVRNEYFPAWNKLVLNEQKKYDVNAMMRKDNMNFDIDMVMELNSRTSLEGIEAYNPPNYTLEDIKKFVAEYKLEGKTGIGIIFINECLSKAREEAIFHFVAINLSTKEILIHERIKGKPKGFGLRNYWAGAVYSTIKQIKNTYFAEWRTRFGKS